MELPTIFAIIAMIVMTGNSQRAMRRPNPLLDFWRDIPRDASLCNYMCPLGNRPRSRLRYVPTYNGCGSYGLEQIQLPQLDIFVECCNAHDVCYGTCGSSKWACDRQFQTCMHNTCQGRTSNQGPTIRQNTMPSQMGLMQNCVATAGLVGTGPVIAGCPAFYLAQNNACRC